MLQTSRQTCRHTDRPSDEAGPRGVFAPKKTGAAPATKKYQEPEPPKICGFCTSFRETKIIR